jgi:4,5-dihydroxyphthalate decarboxylase
MSNELELAVALQEYDHVRDLVSGAIRTPGLRLNFLNMPVPEMFGRFVAHREWEVSELGLGKYTALKAAGDESLTAIPVFPARCFRHGAFYVPGDSKLERLEELAGLRVGIPEWAQTAVTYARGILMHDAGVDLASIHWIQAGVNEPGRREKVALRLPDGVRVTPAPEDSLNDLLVGGRLDAVISAQAPTAFLADGGPLRRLLADPVTAEREYYAQTGIFPIMHTVAIKQELVHEHRWLPGNLVAAFEHAKKRSLARARDEMISRYPVPSISTLAGQAAEMYGDDFWPYGIEANRRTLEAFLHFAYEQGVAERLLDPEELFAPTTHVTFPA